MSSSNRIKTYAQLSRELNCLSDVKLSGLLHQAKPMRTGIGGQSVLLTVDGAPVFVKKIPLTDLEKQPKNSLSTANLFDLPLFYQYGVGSTGFGAWRELATHIMTTNWVISGECPNFPLLYHWRVLPSLKPGPMNGQEWEALERDVKYWENSPTIRNRLEALHHASAYIALFLEYVPQTLYQWLGGQLKAGGEAAESEISFVDQNLKAINEFINERGLLHFDAHFDNILTDGKLIYLSDFGLALSSEFNLAPAEIGFLNAHRTYDRCAAIVNLVHCVIAGLFGKNQWEMRLQEYINSDQGELAPATATTIKQYAPIALIMDDFYQKLQKVSKSTPYPSTQLERLLSEIDKEK